MCPLLPEPILFSSSLANFGYARPRSEVWVAQSSVWGHLKSMAPGPMDGIYCRPVHPKESDPLPVALLQVSFSCFDVILFGYAVLLHILTLTFSFFNDKCIIFITVTPISSSSRKIHQWFKSKRKQTVPLCVYIPGRAVPLHDDLLTQDPPSQDLQWLMPRGSKVLGWEGGSYWEKSPSVCVCSSFFSKAVKPAPKCQIACQHASLCHPSLSQTKAPSELHCVAMRLGKWWCVINGKELSDSAGKQTTSGTLTATWGWSWGVNGCSLMWTKIFHLKWMKWHSSDVRFQVYFWKSPKRQSSFQLVKSGSETGPVAL